MRTFILRLRDSTGLQTLEDVVSFTAEDGSGSFSLWAGHAPFVTALGFGLSRIRHVDERLSYLAMAGGILHFRNNTLTISTQRCFLGDSVSAMNQVLDETLAGEERQLLHLRQNLRRLEESAVQHLWEMQQRGGNRPQRLSGIP